MRERESEVVVGFVMISPKFFFVCNKNDDFLSERRQNHSSFLGRKISSRGRRLKIERTGCVLKKIGDVCD